MAKDSKKSQSKLPAPIAGESVSIGGFKVPLRRTFGALDRLIAIPIEALGDALEGKIKNNIDSHVEAVIRKKQSNNEPDRISDPSVKTSKQIGEWAEGAAEVDADEPTLSAVWRSVLDEILAQGDDAEDLLRVIKSLPSSDIRYFIEVYANRSLLIKKRQKPILSPPEYVARIFENMGDDAAAGRLRTQGLITRTFGTSFVLSFAGLTVGSGYYGYRMLSNTPRWDEVASSEPMQIVIGFVILTFVAFSVMAMNLYRPTKLGRHLRRLYLQYAKVDLKT